MAWTYHFFNAEARDALRLLDDGHRADLKHFQIIVNEFGLLGLTVRQSKPLGNGLFEFRLSGIETIARVFYCTLSGQRIVYLHAIIKKDQKTPPVDLKLAHERCAAAKSEDAEAKRLQAEVERKKRSEDRKNARKGKRQ